MVVRGWSSSPGAGGGPVTGPRTARDDRLLHSSQPARSRRYQGRSLRVLAGPPGVALRPSRGGVANRAEVRDFVSTRRAKIAPEEWLTVAVEPATTAGLGWPMSRTAPQWYRLRRQLAQVSARAAQDARRRGCLHPPGCKHHLLLALTLTRVLVSISGSGTARHRNGPPPVAAEADVSGPRQRSAGPPEQRPDRTDGQALARSGSPERGQADETTSMSSGSTCTSSGRDTESKFSTHATAGIRPKVRPSS